MKKTLSVFMIFFATVVFAGAQHRVQSSQNPSLFLFPRASQRTEIVLPQVNGYNVVKVDLHIHTCYSDGKVEPQIRIHEAWVDGLDALAITDHIEYRPSEKNMEGYLHDAVSVKEYDRKKVVPVDLNFSWKKAEHEAARYGLTLIPGAEITRDPSETGHFNALFTTDNNLLYDPDPLQSIRNAKKQNAIVQSNHPGWKNSSNNPTSVCAAAMAEHLIDGVEIFNGIEFYPDVIERAVKEGWFMAGGTDNHSLTSIEYAQNGVFRDMTLVLAKDSSAESIREALENRRTLAYSYGDIAGGEQLLKDFFKASFDVKWLYKDYKGYNFYKVTNKSSFSYSLSGTGLLSGVVVKGMSSLVVKTREKDLHITALNMWFGPDKHPSVDYMF